MQHQQQDEGGENDTRPTGRRKPGKAGPGLPYGSAHAALAMMYYWSCVVVFYPTVWRLYFAAVIEPVTVYRPETATTPGLLVPGDIPQRSRSHDQHHEQHQQHPQQHLQPPTSYPPDTHDLPVPPRLQTVDPMRFALPRVREAANHICRTLDNLLVNHPLAVPTTVTQPPAEFPPQGDFAWDSEWNFPALSSSSSSSSSSPSLSSTGPAGPAGGPSTTTSIAAVATARPSSGLSDLLWHPLFVATRFYSELEGVPVRMDMNANILASPISPTTTTGIPSSTIPDHGHSHGGTGTGTGTSADTGGGSGSGGGKGKGPITDEGRLELMWCEDLRSRMLEWGRERKEVVMGKRWVGVDLGLVG